MKLNDCAVNKLCLIMRDRELSYLLGLPLFQLDDKPNKFNNSTKPYFYDSKKNQYYLIVDSVGESSILLNHVRHSFMETLLMNSKLKQHYISKNDIIGSSIYSDIYLDIIFNYKLLSDIRIKDNKTVIHAIKTVYFFNRSTREKDYERDLYILSGIHSQGYESFYNNFIDQYDLFKTIDKKIKYKELIQKL